MANRLVNNVNNMYDVLSGTQMRMKGMRTALQNIRTHKEGTVKDALRIRAYELRKYLVKLELEKEMYENKHAITVIEDQVREVCETIQGINILSLEYVNKSIEENSHQIELLVDRELRAIEEEEFQKEYRYELGTIFNELEIFFDSMIEELKYNYFEFDYSQSKVESKDINERVNELVNVSDELVDSHKLIGEIYKTVKEMCNEMMLVDEVNRIETVGRLEEYQKVFKRNVHEVRGKLEYGEGYEKTQLI